MPNRRPKGCRDSRLTASCCLRAASCCRRQWCTDTAALAPFSLPRDLQHPKLSVTGSASVTVEPDVGKASVLCRPQLLHTPPPRGCLQLPRLQTLCSSPLSLGRRSPIPPDPIAGLQISVSITVGEKSVGEACGIAANTTDAVIKAAEGSGPGVTVTTTNINVQPNITYGPDK